MPEDRAPDPAQDDASARLRDAFRIAAQRSSIARVRPGETPSGSALLAAVGGVRGLIESILPGLGFLVVYTITKNVLPSVLAPLVLAVLFIVVRAVQRQPVMSAIVGALGVLVSAVLSLVTGNAADNFVPGLLINAVALVAIAISLVVRRPLIGLLIGLLTGDAEWRRDRAKRRVALVATLLWAGLFVIRLGVELPLYLANLPDALAASKLILGVPLYAGLVWVTWLLIRTAWRPAEEPDAPVDAV